MSRCAPGRQYGLSFSCFSLDEWDLIKSTLTKKEIDRCKNDEVCIFKNMVYKKAINPSLKHRIFKPKYTLDILSNYDINNVLNPYKDAFKNYMHIGTFPSDIYDYINLKDKLTKTFKPKVSKYSIVYNLDKLNGDGTHWVAVFIDVNRSIVEYFDSLAKTPVSNINKNLHLIKKTLDKHYGKNFKIHYNNVVHQGYSGECGVYCVYYIIARLFNYSVHDINNNIKDDKTMTEFRRYIFG